MIPLMATNNNADITFLPATPTNEMMQKGVVDARHTESDQEEQVTPKCPVRKSITSWMVSLRDNCSLLHKLDY